jgi:hydroxypyruvate isomerase
MSDMSRREALGAIGAAAIGSHQLSASAGSFGEPLKAESREPRAGRLKHSIARWCFQRMSIDELCGHAKSIGYNALDLLNEAEWTAAKKVGVDCAIAAAFGSIPQGFNRPQNHDKLVADGERYIQAVAAAGIPNIVVFSGNRGGMSDGEGIANCITGLKRLMPAAEKHGVTLCMEMLNSKVDHKDYHADRTPWAVEVVKGVASARFKLLYDIYHMQIMEGDVIRTIRDNAAHIAHYHTAGVPGRNEIDDTQELNYRRVMSAIADLSFGGYVAQEFIPKRDPVTSLREAFSICNV